MRLVLATGNPGKAGEVTAILGGVGGPGVAGHLELVPRPEGMPEPVEDGATLVDNARIKAAAVLRATGEAAVADDTALEVAALGGQPGVYTARFAGPGATYADNIAKLLAEMEGMADRRARWRTVALVLLADGREVQAEGTCDGVVTEAPRGDGGFGYDPVFVPDDGDGRTFAELSRQEKNVLSHRGRAFRALAAELAAVLP